MQRAKKQKRNRFLDVEAEVDDDEEDLDEEEEELAKEGMSLTCCTSLLPLS